jgi:hypothetical protein
MDNPHSSTEPPSTQTMERPLLPGDSLNTNIQFINEYQFMQNQPPRSTFNVSKGGANPVLSSPETNATAIPAYSSVEVYPMQNELISQYSHPVLQLPNYLQSDHSQLINPEFSMLATKSESEMLQEPIQYQYLPMQNPISPSLHVLETQLPRPIQSLTWPLPVYTIPEIPEPSPIDPQNQLIPNLPSQVFTPNNPLHLTPQNYQLELAQKSNYNLESQHQHQLGQSVQSPVIANKIITPPPPIKQSNLSNPQPFSQSDFINYTITQPNRSQLASSGPFECTECPMTFNRKNSLRRHTQLHRGEKPFHCAACGKSFSRLDIFKRHKISKKCIELTLKFNQNLQNSNNNS